MKITEVVFIAVVSAALGVFWWGYTFFYDIFKPFLEPLGMKYLLAGIWLMGAIFFPYIIRKPGSAILGEIIAAFIQGFIARWGITSLLWGVVQGVPVEIFFLILGYKKWNVFYLMSAGIISAFFSYLLDYFYYKYGILSVTFNLMQLGGFLLSGALLAGVFSKLLADNLKKTGALNQFEIAKSDFE
ncbi:MAG: hypothetical protein B6D62_04910 [Candidatus Cloacimonas sp. 4484_275]|nr:MAG: hypothetical protein B6D62_04910 [Candidatus Cloacimonas sp. 4484_275]RLC50680.1 MAG: hypothetical protein DRZ79_04025 [Candidatus Cloacimonadota bacterium]